MEERTVPYAMDRNKVNINDTIVLLHFARTSNDGGKHSSVCYVMHSTSQQSAWISDACF